MHACTNAHMHKYAFDLTTTYPDKPGLAGGPPHLPTNGFWSEVLWIRCPSWHQPAETNWTLPFIHATMTDEVQGASCISAWTTVPT